ncbi:MAG: peptidylprolyl isomerase [Thiothrix sp.]|nr:peptidylprolyl isomerase [Thiothrix sp.]HPQ95743.1 peptidylprolyl isomerase [Thiolinea sp.]
MSEVLFRSILFAGCLLAVPLNLFADAAWVLKADGMLLSPAQLENTANARGFALATLDARQKAALLEELFIRTRLLEQQDNLTPAQQQHLQQKLEDFHATQQAEMVLDNLAAAGMPDFTGRAREIYAAEQDTTYRQPLKLRVRILLRRIQPDGPDRAAVMTELEQVRKRIVQGELDFTAAVREFSEAGDKALNAGDSFWFSQGQKPDALFDAASQLSPAHPLSDIILDRKQAWLLQFIGRQEAGQQSFDEVRNDIVIRLENEYRNTQRKLVLENLQQQFREQAQTNPDTL